MDHGIIGWLFIIVALVFIFGGAKKIEDLGRGFGGFMREFNKARRDAEQEPVAPAALQKKRAVKKPIAKKKKKA
jgi:TatA/E family protein of Tat protein translocase